MRKLAIFSCSFAAATACYVWLLPPLYALCAAGGLLLAALVLCFFRAEHCVRVRLISFGAAFGLLWAWGYERLRIEPLRAYCGEAQTISAMVCEAPIATQYGSRVTARLGGGRIALYLDCAPEALSLGDTVTVTAKIEDVSRGSGEEENLYFQSRDISLLGFQRGDLEIVKAQTLPLSCWPASVAEKLKTRIASIFPADTSGFAMALLTGDRSGLSYAEQNQMSLAGISHVVAVSGMHISLLVGAVRLLCFRRRRLAAGVSIAVMLFFSAMLGFTPSVTRATIMNSLLLLAPLLRREDDALTSLSFSLLVILLAQPWAIANASLQLSFGAMAGLLLASPHVLRYLDEKLIRRLRRGKRPVRALCGILATTLGASLFATPLIARYFGTVSLIAPVTNLLLLPLVSLIFTLTFAAVALSWIFFPAGATVAWLLAFPVRLILRAASALSGLPYAAVYTNSVYIVLWLVAVYLLLGICLLQKGKYRFPVFAASVLVTLLAALWLSARRSGDPEVTVFDVGQGQCILLRSGELTALVDCGGDSGASDGETVARSLLMAGLREVDYLILTHYDTDHICGAEQLLGRIEVGEMLLPKTRDDGGHRERLLTAARAAGTVCRDLSEDTELLFDGGSLTLFAPPNRNTENASVAVLLSATEYDILITGDMDLSQERQLVRSNALPDIEVLVAGHHGAKTSTGEALLHALKPEIVLISVGENRYGHPAQETLDRIAATGAEVRRTDLEGDITVAR